MAKQKKHILTFDQEYDFDMIGICSHHNDYRLAWGINEQLAIGLIKADENFVATNKKGVRLSEHSYYEFRDPENLIEFYLIKNKHLGKFLIPEKPTVDYFLFIYENYLMDIESIVENLRLIPSILGVFVFDPEEFDSTENIVFN